MEDPAVTKDCTSCDNLWLLFDEQECNSGKQRPQTIDLSLAYGSWLADFAACFGLGVGCFCSDRFIAPSFLSITMASLAYDTVNFRRVELKERCKWWLQRS
jgi:hypothetical protein